MGKFSGKGGLFKISTTQFNLNSWELDEEVSTPDATDSGTNVDYTDHVVGRITARIQVSGFVDSADLPDGKIKPGTALTTVELTIGDPGGGQKPKISISSATVRTLRITSPIGSGDTAAFQGEILVKGAFTTFAMS